jgi:hypothetical protein
MIFGLKTSTENLPDGWTPLEAVAVVKCLDENGMPAFCIRMTETLLTWESFGLLQLAADVQERDCLANFEDEEDDAEA